MIWKCKKCGYTYDSRYGDGKNGIKKDTKFEDIPDDWKCPRCGVGKDRFTSIEIDD
ncbi:MAG: rubredoxin [Methanomicrobium sp.]|nr:rubredoxin [Methanomicrobium sp.]MBP5083127.1 rubredoxin [Methanomicrobium sp.]MBP5474773.1 rubredoxin [Methanomicrobium sp.]